MSLTTRSALIATGIKKAGRAGQNIVLTTEFNEILRDMTERFNILPKSITGDCVADQSYIAMPTDYSDRRFMTLDSTELTWIDPDKYLLWLKTNTDVATIPTHYTVVKEDAKIYFRNKPASALAYAFYYWAIHDPLSSDTYHTLDEKFEEVIIAGLAKKACELMKDWENAAKWELRYERLLLLKAGGNKRVKREMRSNFWQQIGSPNPQRGY